MYLPAGQACNQPNSSTPMTQGRIDAQARRIMRRGQAFTYGNRTLNNLMAHMTPPVARPSAGDLQSSRGIRAGSPFPEPGGGPSPTVNLMSPAQMQNWFDTWAASSAAAAKRANYGTLFMPTVGGSSPGVSSGPAAAGAPGRPAAAGSSGSSPAAGSGGAGAGPGVPGGAPGGFWWWPAGRGPAAAVGASVAAPGAPGGAPGSAGGPGAPGGAPGGGRYSWAAPARSPWPWSLGGGVSAKCTLPEVLPVDTVDRSVTSSGARSSSLPPVTAAPAWEFWAALGLVALGVYVISED